MRKKTIDPAAGSPRSDDAAWLDLDALAEVEITSEEDESPIEAALLPAQGNGWKASVPGVQTIRLRFDHPQELGRIRLEFVENERARTQEFVLRWSPDHGETYNEIVRQQWNFSPPHTTREVEDYAVELTGVTVLELQIVPEIGGGNARASLATMRLA